MCKSIYFETNCVEIPVETFWLQFCTVIEDVIPPNMVRKYEPQSIGVYRSLPEIRYHFRHCASLKELSEAVQNLPEIDKQNLISYLYVMAFELQGLPSDAMVCVPELPKDYIKPFFDGKLTVSNILV